ncbi:MAG: tRNA 2-thiouridine(34) synthase MnmA, partial [Clostridia bacterium]|nr:tRNA 2-thiouridine(34) synthase MnmA [Clostridia bacterium]
GVDSAVTAYIIKNMGYEAFGATVNMFDRNDKRFSAKPNDDIIDAKKVADTIGIDHCVYDFSNEFADFVIKDFTSSYLSGATPNPCIICNKYIKFGILLEKALSLGCSHIASGHYAIIEKDINGRYLLKKGKDTKKDQAYVLWSLSQHQLSHTLFPLGEFSKEEVKAIAESNGFVNSRKKESQDICFIPDGDYASFLSRFLGISFAPGKYVDITGNILGEHKGAIKYTTGQRKGLGISLGQPVYVLGKNMKENTVTIGHERSLFSRSLDADNINFIPFDSLSYPIRVEAKIRYSHSSAKATLEQTSENTFHLEFDEPQRAVTKGQSVVLYDGDYVLGGGIIK